MQSSLENGREGSKRGFRGGRACCSQHIAPFQGQSMVKEGDFQTRAKAPATAVVNDCRTERSWRRRTQW